MTLTQTAPDMTKVPGGWQVEVSPILLGCKMAPKLTEILPNAYRVDNFINTDSIDDINLMMQDAPNFAPVSIQGMQEVNLETTGSFRATMWNETMAAKIDGLVRSAQFYAGLPNYKYCKEDTVATDWWQHGMNREWEYVGVSPMLRYMRYKNGGKHYAHYDAGFIYPDTNYRTLLSFVLYLTTNRTGATRFIEDGQENIPIWERNHSDWTEEVTDDSLVLTASYPKKGSILFFDHRMCHDVNQFLPETEGEERIIIRGDLIYNAIQ